MRIQVVILLLLLAGCGPAPAIATKTDSFQVTFVTVTPRPTPTVATPFARNPWPVTTETHPFITTEQFCSGRFVTHQLDHITTVPNDDMVQMFEANGAGVAINDLDNDGDLDIVLANHAAPNTILWNYGALTFKTEPFGEGDARAALVVDVDGDGWLDIIFSRRVSAPNYWRNDGGSTFTRTVLPAVDKPLYAINWSDLDGDNDLDLVGGTYDAALLVDFGAEFLMGGQAGVYIYENEAGRYRGTQLAGNAQALALALPDLNEDGRPDILVGNDFDLPDYAWLRTDEGWAEAKELRAMTHNTMSYDTGDIDNDGSFEIFATDMKPYADDPATLAAWRPVMEPMLSEPQRPDDPQVMANVLQARGEDGVFANEAPGRGLEASGWSWSGKFGDLDQDGFLDVYVVNGFIEATTFAHLPNHELVEENQARRNDGRGRFEPVPKWGLGSRESGRGMSMGDLDGDGDLDIVVNNLRASAQLFENQLCRGSSLQVDLWWAGSGNSRALGAVLALQTDEGTLYRDVRAASGYLSGDPARVHFGFPAGVNLKRLEIQWPDGEVSTVEGPEEDSLLTISRK